jgi:hypothetical protein
MYLQTKKGNVAKAPTAVEIQDFIKDVNDIVMHHPGWTSVMGEPIYSLDNVSVHTSAVQGWDQENSWWHQNNIWGSCKFVAKWSPDLHQVVEHAHARITHHFQHMLWLEAVKQQIVRKKVTKYMELLQSAFEATCQPDTIGANVHRLKAVYEAVVAARGDWAPRGLR